MSRSRTNHSCAVPSASAAGSNPAIQRQRSERNRAADQEVIVDLGEEDPQHHRREPTEAGTEPDGELGRGTEPHEVPRCWRCPHYDPEFSMVSEWNLRPHLHWAVLNCRLCSLLVQLYNMQRHGQIIIDTSAILAVLLGEPERVSLLESTAGATLVAPASVPWEVGNALSAMLKRGRVTGSQAQQVIESYAKIPLRLIDVDLGAAVEVAGELGLCAYDAYFIVCAAVHRSPLLTLDAALARAARSAGLRLVEVA